MELQINGRGIRRLPVAERAAKSACPLLRKIDPFDDADNAFARKRKINYNISMSIAGRDLTPRYSRFLVTCASEGPAVHDGAVDTADGQAHMLLEVLRSLRHTMGIQQAGAATTMYRPSTLV